MAEIINLRRARKAKLRQEREAEADRNRRRFGRTKAARIADEDVQDRSERALDGKRLDTKQLRSEEEN